MQCSKCSHPNPDTAIFCLECGSRLSLVCTECGTALPHDAKFCLKCGAKVGSPEPQMPADQSKSIPERIRRLIPAEYAERLMQARGQMTGERRLVTILFSDIKGSTAMAEHLDPEDVMEIMDGAFDVLIQPIMRYEGTLARLMGDAILAFFGAPIAHEDDPERACRAALEIIQGAQTYAEKLEQERGISGFNVRVGINTGHVVVGEVGSDLRVEYTAMGDAINLAARMEQHAEPGSILITHDTYRHIRGVFDVQPQEPLTVKGKAEPVQTYVVQRAKPRAFRLPTRGVEGIETRMVGREAELRRLQDALLDTIEDSERQVITIVGDAGVGKSRLLYEFDNWVELLPQTIRYFKGRARQELQNVPYALLRDLFAFRFQIQDSDSAEAVRQKMTQGVTLVLAEGAQSEQKAHIIGHFIGYDFSTSKYLEDLRDDPQELHEQALSYTREYFRASAQINPTALILEDLHWADDSSLDVLDSVAELLQKTRFLVVCATRPSLFERRPHWGEGQPYHRQLQLEPLSRRESRRLVLEILQRVQDVPDALRDLIVVGAEGNPFFIEELIKMLVEDGVVVIDQHTWRVEPDQLARVRVPDSLTAVLQARLDRLPLEERTILQQASVVGRLFWDRAVAHIRETAPEGPAEAEVNKGLNSLRDREMVFRRERSAFADTEEYIFKHALLREITYASVLKRLRKVYHGLVADWLVEEAGDREGEITGLIAEHLEAAGRTEEAIERLLETGDQARLRYAHDEAIGSYERALALLNEDEQTDRAARILMKLGLTHHSAFHFQRSRDVYDRAFTIWQQAAAVEAGKALPEAPHPLRVLVWEPLTLDPSRASDEPSASVIRQLFAGLLEVNIQLDVVPHRAQRWEISDGGRRFVLHLHDRARWSDGRPVTPEDYVCAVHRMLHPLSGVYPASVLHSIRGAKDYNLGQVSSPDAVRFYAIDPSTIVMELDEPVAYALHLLGMATPVPRHMVEVHGDAWADPEHIVTSGPFELEAWERGASMTLIRTGDSEGQARGNVRKIELTFQHVEDWQDHLARYEADELDGLNFTEWPPAAFEELKRRQADDYILAPALWTVGIQFYDSLPAFNDQRVRQALAMAIDRETLADVVLAGYASPATGGFLPPGMLGHQPGISLPYDPAQARRLLAEAGYADGRGLPVIDAMLLDRPTSKRVAPFIQACWHDSLGVESSWKPTGYLGTADTSPQAHLGPIRWIADYPDPDSFLRVAWSHHSQLSGWMDPTYSRLVSKARTMSDPAARANLYQEADRVLTQSAVIVPLFYCRNHLLVKPWLRNYTLSPIGRPFLKDVIIYPH